MEDTGMQELGVFACQPHPDSPKMGEVGGGLERAVASLQDLLGLRKWSAMQYMCDMRVS